MKKLLMIAAIFIVCGNSIVLTSCSKEEVTAQAKKEYFRAQNAKRRAALAAQEQPEEAPVEAQEAPVKTPQEQPEWAKDERLMMRIADSTDYTNALLNGILKRLMDICDALGVSGDGK